MPTRRPRPKPSMRYVIRPPDDGKREPSFTQTYPSSSATPPPIRNESQTAAPATAPASPSRAKIPAPIIDPTPRNVAPRTVSAPVPGVPFVSEGAPTALPNRRRDADERADDHDHEADVRPDELEVAVVADLRE